MPLISRISRFHTELPASRQALRHVFISHRVRLRHADCHSSFATGLPHLCKHASFIFQMIIFLIEPPSLTSDFDVYFVSGPRDFTIRHAYYERWSRDALMPLPDIIWSRFKLFRHFILRTRFHWGGYARYNVVACFSFELQSFFRRLFRWIYKYFININIAL